MTTIVQVEFRESMLSIRDDILRATQVKLAGGPAFRALWGGRGLHQPPLAWEPYSSPSCNLNSV